MSIPTRLMVALCSLILLWGIAPVSFADEMTDVADAIGVTPEPADYVLVLDTSGSMTKDGAWSKAVAAVSGLAGSLGPGDRLSVVTFDEFTDLAWEGEHPIDVAALTAALPSVPEGERTDIGAGLAAALDVLERPEAHGLSAVVLMTDGEITTEPDSPYKTMGSPAWNELAGRAAALGGDTAAFALGLAQVTDAAAMQRVFPGADLVADGVEIVDYLSGLSREVLLHRIDGALAPDNGAQLEISWKDDAVTISSPMTLVPVQLTELTLSDGAGTVEADGPVVLGPGESVTLPVEVASGFAGEATLVGTVTSPWQATLSQLAFTLPTLSSAALSVAAVEPTPRESAAVTPALEPEPEREEDETGSWSFPGFFWPTLAGAGLVAALGVWLAMAARPRMSGSLSLEGHGHRREIGLAGRRMVLPENPLGIRGHVSGRRGVTPVRVRLVSSEGPRLKQGLANGQPVTMGDATVMWQDERSVLEARLGLRTPG